MTQYPNQGYYDPMMQPPVEASGGRSGLAVTALVLSLLGIIPACGVLTAPIGVLLGLIGLVAISPPKKGKGMCVVAIVLGIIFTSLQIWAGVWMWNRFVAPIMTGPRAALVQGFAGNISGFKSEFTGPGSTASDDEARAFIEQLRSRYGEFQSITFDPNGPQPQPGSQQPEQTFPYVFNFSNKQGVQAEATYVFATQGANATLVMKWREIKINDPVAGDLIYPATSATSAPPALPRGTAPAGDDGADAPGDSDGDDGG